MGYTFGLSYGPETAEAQPRRSYLLWREGENYFEDGISFAAGLRGLVCCVVAALQISEHVISDHQDV